MFKAFSGLALILLLSLGSGVSAQDSQPLQGRALDNVVAFTKLVGYVRYFYPGDVAAKTDWDTFTIQNIESVEAAADAVQLAEQLNRLFTPYAPLVQVFPSEAAFKVPAELQTPPADAASLTMWVHIPMRVAGAGRDTELWPGTRIETAIGAKSVEFNDNDWVRGMTPPLSVAVHDPSQPYIADLGGGVSAMIPLAIYSDASGTLPHVPVPARNVNATDKRDVYLAAVVKAWNAIEYFWTYWDTSDVDWEAALREALVNASQAPDDAAALVALRRMMAQLGDGHTFTTQPDAPKPPPGTLPFTWDVIENQLTITTMLTDKPPLRSGDVITAINGQPAMDVIQQHLELISPKKGYGLYNALLEMSARQNDKTIQLEIKPFSGTEPYTLDVAYVVRNPGWMRENRPPLSADLGGGIAYLDLSRAHKADIQGAMDLLKQAKGIVFDMRGYPPDSGVIELLGHLTDKVLNTAPFWLPVVTDPDHANIQLIDVTYPWVQPAEPRLTDNIAWLINANGTVSYAESIMGIMEGYHLGKIVGAPSAGTNGDIVSMSLPGGFYTSWTGLRVTKFDGSPLMGVGVLPDVPIERTLAGVAAGRDELLEKAFEVVSGEPASAMIISKP